MLENNIKKIKAESLRTQVYAKLKEQLIAGVWKDGEKLPSEYKLCEMFGVSRVTIRAAIQQLGILGLVETKQGGGTSVKIASYAEQFNTLHPVMPVQKNQDLITILEYRKIVEKGTIALAQEKSTPEDILELENIYQKMQNSVGNLNDFSEADILFHYKLGEISRNPIIIKVYRLIWEMLSVAMEDITHIQGIEFGLKYHRLLIDAIKNRDKARCEELMEEHIEKTIQKVWEANIYTVTPT
ncbi:GntR family transcriptional regulator [Spirochaetia bacterium]|nr:GntR family transcriptional regulator [Spirochaetia bacterium]